MKKRWMLDEQAHAGPEHLDAGFVAGFDRKQGFPDPTDDIAELVSHGIDESSTVVDLGAGTGQFALAAAARFARVVAADVSTIMLDHVRERARDLSLHNIEIVPAGFLSYDHAGEPADAVYSRHALHQIPDFWKAIALQRLGGFLRPGGVLRLRDLVYDFEPSEADELFDGWLAGAGGDPTAGYTAADYAEHIRTEHSTFRWLLEPMLTAAGFDIVDVRFAGPFFGAYTCVRR